MGADPAGIDKKRNAQLNAEPLTIAQVRGEPKGLHAPAETLYQEQDTWVPADANRFSRILAPPVLPATRDQLEKLELINTLIRGGLDIEDACTIAERGVSAQQATDLMNVAMLHPDLERFGQAVVTLRILAEARAAGAVSPARVREIFDAHRDMVVVRPDGVLARMISGEPLQRTTALPIGATYLAVGGVLHEVDEEYHRGSVVGELGLARGKVGAAMDGAESAIRDMLVGVAVLIEGLIDRPEATLDSMVDNFGRVPAVVADLIRRSPELYRQFQDLPEYDRIAMVSKLATSVFLMVAGGAGVAGSVGRFGAGMSGGLAALELVNGERIVFGIDMAIAAADSGLAGAHLAILSGSAKAVATSDAAEASTSSAKTDARTEWKTAYRVRRGIGDIADRGKFALKDLLPALEIAAYMGADAASLVRQQIRDRLARDTADLALADLPEIADAARKMGIDVEAATFKALGERMKREVAVIKALPEDSRQMQAIKALRSMADTAQLDLNLLLCRGTEEAPLASLSPGAQRAFKAIQRGDDDISVATRSVAQEVLDRFPDLVDTGNWGWPMIKGLLSESKTNTFHWDDVFGPDGVLLHHQPDDPNSTRPHLQLHLPKKTVRLFFPRT